MILSSKLLTAEITDAWYICTNSTSKLYHNFYKRVSCVNCFRSAVLSRLSRYAM